MNKFEEATKQKLRFNFKGQQSVEELWDMSLPQLDTLAKSLDKELESSKEKSFITPATTTSSELQLKFDIVLHIIKVKMEERDNKIKAEVLATKKAKLLDLKDRKENALDEELSLEEINKRLTELEQ